MASIIKVDDVQDAAGNNIINEAGDTITIGASGDTITIPSGATLSNLGTATGFNNPAFYATAGVTAQTIADTTFTKMNFGTEVVDTNSAYDTSAMTFTVPAGEGGLYCFFNNIRMPLSDGEESAFMIDVDGSSDLYSGQQNYPGANGSFYHNYSTLLNLSAGAVCYLKMYVTSSGSRTTIASYCYFGGYKIGV